MPRFWSLPLSRIEHLPMLRSPSKPVLPASQQAMAVFFGTHVLSTLQGTSLMGTAARNGAACQSSMGLSVLRQPAHRCAAHSASRHQRAGRLSFGRQRIAAARHRSSCSSPRQGCSGGKALQAPAQWAAIQSVVGERLCTHCAFRQVLRSAPSALLCLRSPA